MILLNKLQKIQETMKNVNLNIPRAIISLKSMGVTAYGEEFFVSVLFNETKNSDLVC